MGVGGRSPSTKTDSFFFRLLTNYLFLYLLIFVFILETLSIIISSMGVKTTLNNRPLLYYSPSSRFSPSLPSASPSASTSSTSFQFMQLLPGLAGAIGLFSFGTLLWKVIQTHNVTSFPLHWILLNLTAQVLVLIYGVALNAWGIYLPSILFSAGLVYMLYIKVFSQDSPPPQEPEGGAAKPPFVMSPHTQPSPTTATPIPIPTPTQQHLSQQSLLQEQLNQFRFAEQLEEPWGQKDLPKSVADQPIPLSSNIQFNV
jgi:hypothetical protein